jgi:muramoyltetrapeptide carboxypeptidase
MTRNLLPEKLERGDTIGIVSPSQPVLERARFERGLRILRELGYDIMVSKNALKRHHHLAGTDEERANDINEMFSNESVKAVLPTSGGTGAARIVAKLEYDLMKKNPKIFAGMSDISILLNAIHRKTGLVTFHTVDLMYGIADYGGKSPASYTWSNLMRTISRAAPLGTIERLTQWKILKQGRAKGRLIGGNIHCIDKLIGSEYEPDWRGAILFLEEVGQSPSFIDRNLMHYKLAGVLGEISGLVVGKLTDCKENQYRDNPMALEEVIMSTCEGFDFPVLYDVDFGHHVENITLPIGLTATVDTEQMALSIDEKAVE